jgi:outer membrane lipoprotein
MVKRYMMGWTILASIVVLAACAGGISKEASSQVTYTGGFLPLRQQTQQYVGETVMVGGKIIENRVGDGWTELIVLQAELYPSGRPKEDDRSDGRFIVKTKDFLDPALYPPGSPVTVVAKVEGSEKRDIGQMGYDYPLLQLIEIKKWSPAEQESPRFHFGFGVGTRF